MTKEKFRQIVDQIFKDWIKQESEGSNYEMAPHNINQSIFIIETAVRALKDLKRVYDLENPQS
jgi:hypothetical protein